MKKPDPDDTTGNQYHFFVSNGIDRQWAFEPLGVYRWKYLQNSDDVLANASQVNDKAQTLKTWPHLKQGEGQGRNPHERGT